MEKDIVIIGAGITGLTLAHCLNRGQKDFLVLEKSDHIGGVVNTVIRDGFVYETGPNTSVIGNDYVVELFDELGARCRLLKASKKVNKRYILKNGKWRALPSGLISGITTPLFSFRDKLRLLGEPFRKPGTDPNESLAELVKRRMGKTFLDYAIDPFILGVYAGDPAYLVPRFAFPKLYNLEQQFGSFIGGSIKQKRERKKTGYKTKATREVFSTEGGLVQLTEALYRSAGEDNFMRGLQNIQVKPSGNVFHITGTNQQKEPVDIMAGKVILTMGAHEIANILSFLTPAQLAPASDLIYAKVIQVNLGFKHWKGGSVDGFGGLIPFREKRDILGILYISSFFEGRAPEKGALLSVFLGGTRRKDIWELSDDEIKNCVKREVSTLMELKEFNPEVFQISRHSHAIPQYGAGSEARIQMIREIQQQYPGLVIAGNLRDGIGMADRIKQAYETAKLIAGQM